VFYQFTRAYAIGSLVGDNEGLPLALALHNTETGVVIETVMMGESELSNLFGFTRSDFHVEVDHMTDTVAYLKTLAPQLSISELFTSLGRPIETSAVSVC